MHQFLRNIAPRLYILALFLQCSIFSQTEQARITSIDFAGNSFFSNGELNGFIASKPGTIYSPLQFELDLKNILKNYNDNGFTDCRIKSSKAEFNFDSSGVTLSAEIEEGPKVLIGEIQISGNRLFSTELLKNSIDTKTGTVLNSLTLSADMTELLNMYEKKGYTFASVNVTDISQYESGGRQMLRINIRIDENDRVRIDNIKVEGNTETKENVVLREISLGEDNSITKENLVEIRRRLENLGYFETVEQPRILKYKNSTVLLIRVKEGNTNTFDGILGYVPPSQSEDRGYFTGLVNLSIRNLFGTGRKVEARFKKEIKSTQELELEYLEPWILGYPVNMNFAFLQRIEDSSYTKRNLSLKADAMISKKITLSAIFNYERVIPNTKNSVFTLFDSRILGAGAEIRYDSRDYVYNPFSGILYRTSYSVGQKKIYNTASFPNMDIPADFTVQKGSMDIDLYYSFFKRQSSLLGLHGIEIRSPRFEAADLFRLGGNSTIRGYREGQFLASRAAWGNFEIRYSLTRRSFAAVFYDAGYYLKPEDDLYNILSQEGFIYGYGLGVRIETSLGMFGVSYALGKGDSILEGKIHFGLINDF
ncbi:MAG TPA: POTRA domain-containing protein [Ignavibacteria bacterium]|nr:POTRA domain-containing protein [Ignavibacteria bacterium]HMQ99146.1 POTRA domain-containing protein [Ignavibacteria bacterium]